MDPISHEMHVLSTTSQIQSQHLPGFLDVYSWPNRCILIPHPNNQTEPGFLSIKHVMRSQILHHPFLILHLDRQKESQSCSIGSIEKIHGIESGCIPGPDNVFSAQ